MTLKIEGYDLTQLAQLGKNVETVDTRKLSVSGDAQHVAQVYMALGLFAPVVAELQKRVPEKEPVTQLTREQENAAIGLGISTEEALAMANGEPAPKFQFVYPTREVPFGYVFPTADPNNADSVMVREHALRNFNVMLHEYVRGTIGWEKSSGNFNRTTIEQACKRAEQLWNVCKPLLNTGELAMAFRGTVDRYGKCTYRKGIEE